MTYSFKDNSKCYIVTLANNKIINVSYDIIDDIIEKLDVSIEQAIDTYLFDKGCISNDIVDMLSDKAKKNKVKIVGSSKEPAIKPKSAPVQGAKATPQKEKIIDFISKGLEIIATDIAIPNKGKLITFKVDNIAYKLDLTQTRAKGGK